MAKLPALVAALAAHDPRGVTAVQNYARIVREAGLIPTTKRGSGAADMTEREAVNLVLGLAEVANTRRAPETIRILRRALSVAALEGEDDPLEKLEDVGLADKASSLGEFFEEIMTILSNGLGYIPQKNGHGGLFFKELRLTSRDFHGCDAYFVFEYAALRAFEIHFHALSEEAYEVVNGAAAEDLADRLVDYSQAAMRAPSQGINFGVTVRGEAIEHLARALTARPSSRRKSCDGDFDEI